MDEKKPKVEKEAESSVSQYVVLRMEMDGQQEVNLRIRRDSNLGKLVQSYCTHMGLQKELLRFTFDGVRLKEHLTPHDLGFQDGDVIDVFSEQDGGAAAGDPILR